MFLHNKEMFLKSDYVNYMPVFNRFKQLIILIQNLPNYKKPVSLKQHNKKHINKGKKMQQSITSIDIGSAPFEDLSNFTPRDFIFRGIECKSIEGLIQSLKTPLPDKQIRLMQMVGLKAKRKGQKMKWFLEHKLYWQGKEICRFSDEYQDLIKEIFTTVYQQDENFRQSLGKTGTSKLTHDIGKKLPKYTVLTEDEFCGILIKLRDS
jgi:hypothetical protein